MAEKQIDAGLEIVAKLKMDAAGLLRDIAALERNGVRLNIRPTADASAIKAISQELDKVYQKEKMTISQLGRELGASRSTPGAGIYRPEEDVSDANRRKAVRDYYEKQNNDALAKKARAEEKSAKEADYFGKAMEFLGQGRPQRAVSTLATGALTPVLGEAAGGILGGAAGLVLGGMMFKIGYQITQSLEKIPEMIDFFIERARSIRMTEAMSPGSGVGARASVGAAREEFSQFGNPADLQKIVNNLQVTAMAGAGTPEEQSELGTLAALADWWRPDAGNANEVSQKIQRMRKTGEFRKDIGNIPFVMDRLIEKYERNIPPGLASYEQKQQFISEALARPENFPGGTPNPRAIGRKEVESEWSNTIHENPVLRSMLSEQTGRNIFGHWWERSIAGYNSGQVRNFFEDVEKRRVVERSYTDRGLEVPKAMRDTPLGGEAWNKRESELTGLSSEQIEKLVPFAKLMTGDPSGLDAMGKVDPHFIGANPQFSFNGATELVHKMQMHAGVNIEAADITAKNTTDIAATLKSIESKLPGATTVSAATNKPHWQHG